MNPYARLLPMLAGIGSPGTISRVLKGESKGLDLVENPSNGLDGLTHANRALCHLITDCLCPGGTRPLELATLRLQNMIQILTKWPKLAPENSELITQQGGTLVFEGKDVIYEYKDKGILVYTDILDMLRAIGARVD
ncbi:unnamed protein product [Chrysoparadoxa australica]